MGEREIIKDMFSNNKIRSKKNVLFILNEYVHLADAASYNREKSEWMLELENLITGRLIEEDMSVTNIEFVNEDGNLDETQFDTQDEKELAELWWDFCKENNIIVSVNKGIADYESGVMK